MRKIAIAAAAVMAASVLTCGCSAKKSSKRKNVPEKPAEWAVAQRSVDDITPLEGETQVYVKRDEEDEDILRLVQGQLADRAVNNEYDALDIISEYSKELGIVDAQSELRYESSMTYSDKMCYKFEQYCDDIKVENSYVELTVDMLTGNKPEILNSTYTDTWGLETKPRVSAAEAVQCAKAKYKTDKDTKPELTITSGAELAWKVAVNDEKIGEVYINAENGDMIF